MDVILFLEEVEQIGSEMLTLHVVSWLARVPTAHLPRPRPFSDAWPFRTVCILDQRRERVALLAGQVVELTAKLTATLSWLHRAWWTERCYPPHSRCQTHFVCLPLFSQSEVEPSNPQALYPQNPNTGLTATQQTTGTHSLCRFLVLCLPRLAELMTCALLLSTTGCTQGYCACL